MADHSIYKDIAARCGGNIYIGVVGPVRTGKSTFIKRFMETLILPAMTDPHDRNRTIDALPQSAGGRTVMTTEPKFIPDEAVAVTLEESGAESTVHVRMIDCVGYTVPDAVTVGEGDGVRMVHTPWSETPLPFEEAAEIGTNKVITEHATIAVLVTTDGSVGEIPRRSYLDAEKRVVAELQAHKKPFVIVLNSAHPENPDTQALGLSMEASYHAPVALVSCPDMDKEDIRHILGLVLEEFPVREIGFTLPAWLSALPPDHAILRSLSETLRARVPMITKTGEIPAAFADIASENDLICAAQATQIRPGTGSADVTLSLDDRLFYRTLGEETGFDITSEGELFSLLTSLASVKKQYEHLEDALRDVREHGYGIVMPDFSELKLDEPEIVRQNGSWGVRFKATAPSIHMIRANIEAQVAPIVGTPLGSSEQQSEEMVKFLLHEYEEEPAKLWATNMFGKSLYELVGEGLHGKLANMPDDARQKIGETLERIINEGSGGLICILL